ncbi:MAG TPA: hypothetical protein VGS41_15300, partial [Chthonomonadales bacterium]|nr:hypothetical protein [Chthonomonadales bacterium]
MQHGKEDQQDYGLVKNIEQQLELSAAWRALLGLEDSPSEPGAANDAPGAPVLKNDPWSALLQTQGIEAVDLQKLHMQTAQLALDERDVELALNN